MLPLIGITCSSDDSANRFFLSKDYVHAVVKVGGTPVILPSGGIDPETLVTSLNGLLLSGGGDINPLFFDEEPLPFTGEVDPARDEFELKVTQLALERGMPVLGICRGMQVLNVAAGGTVCQDISLKVAQPLKHCQQAPRWCPTHSITVEKETQAARILGEGMQKVNSYHHQVIGDLAPGFLISATAPDGVEEIIECCKSTRWVMGVQFHPENMWRHNSSFVGLFSCFVRHSF